MVGKKIYVLHYNERDGKAETVIIKGYPFRKGRTSVAGIVTHIVFVSKTHTHTLFLFPFVVEEHVIYVLHSLPTGQTA